MIAPLTTSEIFFRLLAATVAGALIGIERETHGRPAGLRTTLLACVASALAMIVSETLFIESGTGTSTWRPDPARLGAGVLTGIGFLGAGTILRHDNVVRGVTTAACLWFATVLGVAFGSGLYIPGAIGFGIAIGSLLLLPKLEKHIASDRYSTLTIVASIDSITEQSLRSHLKKFGLKPRRMKLRYNLESQIVTLSVEVKSKQIHAADMPTQLIDELRTSDGIREIRWT